MSLLDEEAMYALMNFASLAGNTDLPLVRNGDKTLHLSVSVQIAH